MGSDEGPGRGTTPPIPWLRTALVCDEPAPAEDASTLLRDLGAKVVHVAATSDEALDSLGKLAPSLDLVLLEIFLENDAAPAVISASRRLAPQALIVLMSERASAEASVELVLSGAHAFLAKPLDSDKLHHKLVNIDRRRLAGDRFYELARNEGLVEALAAMRDWTRNTALHESGGSVSVAARAVGASRAHLHKLLAGREVSAGDLDVRRYPVLCVDDDTDVLVTLRYALADRFTVLTASSGAEALEILRTRDVAVLMADVRMPEMNGIELCARARAVRPDIVSIVCTAYANLDETIDAINRGRVRGYVRKPWSEHGLHHVLRVAIEEALSLRRR